MAINVKSITTVAAKWKTNASGAAAAYAAGAANPKQPWAATTAAAADTWSQAVAAAAANGSFANGVNNAGDAKWANGVTTLGQTRYPQGVNAAQAKYQAGEAPYLTALSQINLPARGVKGSNAARVQAVVDAMMATKKAQG